MSSLINKNTMYSGIYRAKVIEDGNDIRVYVPSIMNGITDYMAELKSLPKAQWCAYNLESCDMANIVEPMWVMFEAGDVSRPVILSYTVIGSGDGSGSGTGSGSGGGSSSNNENMLSASGIGVYNIKGPVNDEACASLRQINTKYSDISQVPQKITQEYTISGCLSAIAQYSNQSIGSNSIVPIAKAIKSSGGGSSKSIPELRTTVVCVGNAILCATTDKFGTDGDYLYVHFTDGDELLFVRFDQKSRNHIYGEADPANEWGHWVDYESGFSNATEISILEICGMDIPGIAKTCDFIVNLGSFINDSSLAFKSMEEIKTYAHSKFTIDSSGLASFT